MAKFKKAILKANRTYHSPDGQVRVTPERLKHWADSFNAMNADGLAVPVSWGHSDVPADSLPIKFASDGKKPRPPEGTVGYLHSVKLAPDGNSAQIELDIRGGANNEKVEQNLAFVSPVIRETFADGQGKRWTDVWGHMDLVQHPVDNTQTPFVKVKDYAIACALRMGLDDGKPVTYRMAEHEDMADADSKGEGGSEETGSDRLKNVIEALAGMSIVLPDDTTAENFFERVESALLTAAAMGGRDVQTDTDDLEESRPEFAALGLEVKRWRGHADKEHREKVGTRLSVLLDKGQCTPAEYRQQEAALGSVRLSLDSQGNHQPARIESWIESREAVPSGTFWDAEKRTRMSNLEVAPHPQEVTGVETEESANEVADEVLQAKR